MTPELQTALRAVANVQLKLTDSIASTLGADVAQEMTRAYQSLLVALEPEQPKPTAIFGGRVFVPKKKAKKT